MRLYHVYILASRSRTLYVGMSGKLDQRLFEHRNGVNRSSFASRYRTLSVVHLEEYSEVWDAIRREKQIKSWRRSKKVELIEATNPDWTDLCSWDEPLLVR